MTNLKPRNFRGVMSEGMIMLSKYADGKLEPIKAKDSNEATVVELEDTKLSIIPGLTNL